MEVIRKESSEDRISAILLLTDGQPNINPPDGHILALKKYQFKYPLCCSIHTYGYGYNLDSVLLNDLAVTGSG